MAVASIYVSHALSPFAQQSAPGFNRGNPFVSVDVAVMNAAYTKATPDLALALPATADHRVHIEAAAAFHAVVTNGGTEDPNQAGLPNYSVLLPTGGVAVLDFVLKPGQQNVYIKTP